MTRPPMSITTRAGTRPATAAERAANDAMFAAYSRQALLKTLAAQIEARRAAETAARNAAWQLEESYGVAGNTGMWIHAKKITAHLDAGETITAAKLVSDMLDEVQS